jgi:hypothetical protein
VCVCVCVCHPPAGLRHVPLQVLGSEDMTTVNRSLLRDSRSLLLT